MTAPAVQRISLLRDIYKFPIRLTSPEIHIVSPDFFVPVMQYGVCRCNIEFALIGRFLGWITGKMAFFGGKKVLARNLHMTCCDREV